MNVTRRKRKSQWVKTKSSRRLQNKNISKSSTSSLNSSISNASSNESLSNGNATLEGAVDLQHIQHTMDSIIQEESKNNYVGFKQETSEKLGFNRKFYGSRKRKFLRNYNESFGLPDQPIYSNGPIFIERNVKSHLDANSADPWDISVLDLKLIDQPWLVQNPEVITPYWDVESLFPFDEVRIKVEPELIEALDETYINENFNCFVEIFENVPDSPNKLFTSTPVKKESTAVINIENQGEKVNISFIKDEVVKVLEEAVKENTKIGNIDMKIQIVASNNYQEGSTEFETIGENAEIQGLTLRSRRKLILKNYASAGTLVKVFGSENKRSNKAIKKSQHVNSNRNKIRNISHENVSIMRRKVQSSLGLVDNCDGNRVIVEETTDSDHESNTDSSENTSNIKSPSKIKILNEIQASVRDIIDKTLIRRLRSTNTSSDESASTNVTAAETTLKLQSGSISTLSTKKNTNTSKRHKASPVKSNSVLKSKLSVNLIPLTFRLGRQEDFQSELEIVSNLTSSEKNTNSESDEVKVKEEIDEKNEPETGTYFKNTRSLNVDIKSVFALGDFVWAQVGKCPYWPAFICEDPITTKYFKSVSYTTRPTKIYYHIRFFGDNGRRSWILRKRIMLYCSKLDLEMIATKLKSENKSSQFLRPYLLYGRSAVIAKWHQAVEEVELTKRKSYKEVLAYLLEASQKHIDHKTQLREERLKFRKSHGLELKRKRSLSSTSCDSELSELEDDEPLIHIDKKTKRGSREVEQKGKGSPSSQDSDHSKVLERKRELSSSRNDLSSSKTKRSSSKETDDSDNEPLINRLGKIADELSETDSKTSSTNSQLYSFEYQTELYRKNNLFNGYRNIKVCDYCMKQGEIFKCKGKCGNYFHPECVSKVLTPRVREGRGRPKKSNTSLLPKNKEPETPTKDIVPKNHKNEQVQIITVKTRRRIERPPSDVTSPQFYKLTLSEQIDLKMKEIMSKFDGTTTYQNDSTDSSSEEGPLNGGGTTTEHTLRYSTENLILSKKQTAGKSEIPAPAKVVNNMVCHVTADSVVPTIEPSTKVNSKCTYCQLDIMPTCFACGLEVSLKNTTVRKKCSHSRCTKYFHPTCLKIWPQTQWSFGKWSKNQDNEDTFTCPSHLCHTCFSEELSSNSRLPGEKLARCMLCPVAFHATSFCVPAGSQVLGASQIICPKHRSRPIQPINTNWCFICAEGGNLVCCDTCPTSVHPECQPITFTDDDKYICEDCESGRFPLYDEVLWVKLGHFRWWPALVLFPNEIPTNVKALKRHHGDFAVRFFGTNDHYWVNRSRVFSFQEGDRGGSEMNRSKNKVYRSFEKAIEDAAIAFKLKKEFRSRREAEGLTNLKPPPFVKINKNKPVGNVKLPELNISNVTPCECDPKKPHPCGLDSDCINRLLMTECDPDTCLAGTRCRNQAFQKREYLAVVPQKTQGRGWGLKCLTPIKAGQFIIEYVGELIDTEEYSRRIRKMHEQKETNYYFMTVDSERMIDAGPKGNYSRFINHSCDPNCITQKWTIKGDTRVGIFSNCDIEAGSELTFNYNLEVAGQEKKICRCGASNCSGFIGVKVKNEQTSDTKPAPSRSRKSLKKKPASPLPVVHPPCFMCGEVGSDLICHNKACNKAYHLKCLNLEQMPEASKFSCPRHNCNICSNRTIRCCVKCINSFCPSHAETNVRHDKFLGFVCKMHDPGMKVASLTQKRRRSSTIDFTDESVVSSTTFDDDSSYNPGRASSTTSDQVSLIVDSPSLKMPTNTSESDSEASLKVSRIRTRAFRKRRKLNKTN